MERTQGTPPVVLVKWKTPEDELVNVARIVEKFRRRRTDKLIKICIGVPNGAWASQAVRSLQMLDIAAVPYMPVRRLEPQTKAALAALDFLARQNEASRNALMAFGKSEADCDQLLSQYGNARGFSLLRATGMKDAPQLQHVMSLVDGDEDAASLRALVREQLTRPRAREDSDEVVVMDYRAINGNFDHLILIACVDGMVGNSAQAPNEQALHAFQDAPAHATRDCIVSYFTRIDKSMADQARINYTRTKTENGTLLAMSKPTPFLTAETSKRPSTMSGQALLRTYGLN